MQPDCSATCASLSVLSPVAFSGFILSSCPCSFPLHVASLLPRGSVVPLIGNLLVQSWPRGALLCVCRYRGGCVLLCYMGCVESRYPSRFASCGEPRSCLGSLLPPECRVEGSRHCGGFSGPLERRRARLDPFGFHCPLAIGMEEQPPFVSHWQCDSWGEPWLQLQRMQSHLPAVQSTLRWGEHPMSIGERRPGVWAGTPGLADCPLGDGCPSAVRWPRQLFPEESYMLDLCREKSVRFLT